MTPPSIPIRLPIWLIPLALLLIGPAFAFIGMHSIVAASLIVALLQPIEGVGRH